MAWLDRVKQAAATEIAKAEAGAAKKTAAGEPTRQPANVEPAQPTNLAISSFWLRAARGSMFASLR